MENNLKQVKKSLRSFAKRCKNFKYTESALIAFLIAGIIFTPGKLFSAASKDDANIENQKHTISTSMQDIQKTLKKTRIENNKLMKYTTLELIQLMEQGDHVVKSPWSSWQYGIIIIGMELIRVEEIKRQNILMKEYSQEVTMYL